MALTVLSVEVETLKEILLLMQELTQSERDRLLCRGEEIARTMASKRADLRSAASYGAT